MSTQRIPSEKVQFIHDNKRTMKQADIARHLKICPSAVNQIIKGKRRIHWQVNDEYFNLEEFAKWYNF